MDLEVLSPDRAALEELLGHICIARGGQQGREHVDVRDDPVEDRTGLDLARPAQERRNAPAAFPVRVLL